MVKTLKTWIRNGLTQPPMHIYRQHRFKEHLADIKHTHTEIPVSAHINKRTKQTGMIFPSILEIINKNPDLQSNTEFRKKRELYWIHKLKTLTSFGLNTFS